MRIILAAFALCGLMAGMAGCATHMAVEHGQQGKAYIVRDGAFSSTMWNCDATSGKPICYKVIKQ